MTHADPDQPAKSAAIGFARRLVEHWQEALGTELLGAYLIGSLAHAGFSRRYSDIDLALVTRAGLTAPMLDRMRSDAVALSAEWGPKVSAFRTDQHFSRGRETDRSLRASRRVCAVDFASRKSRIRSFLCMSENEMSGACVADGFARAKEA
jgi:predicted nucleotidyltransferase